MLRGGEGLRETKGGRGILLGKRLGENEAAGSLGASRSDLLPPPRPSSLCTPGQPPASLALCSRSTEQVGFLSSN